MNKENCALKLVYEMILVLNVFALRISASLFLRCQQCIMNTYRYISVVNEFSFTVILIRMVRAYINKTVTGLC